MKTATSCQTGLFTCSWIRMNIGKQFSHQLCVFLDVVYCQNVQYHKDMHYLFRCLHMCRTICCRIIKLRGCCNTSHNFSQNRYVFDILRHGWISANTEGLKVLLSVCFNLLFIWEYYSRSYNYGMWQYIIRLMFCFYEMMKVRCVPFHCTEGISI